MAGWPRSISTVARIAFAAAATAAFAPLASAQTCAAPRPWLELESFVTVDTCQGEHVTGGFCSGSVQSPGPVASVSIHYDPTCMVIQQVAVSSEQPGLAPVMYVSSDVHECAQGSCLGVALAGQPLAWTGFPPGDYTFNVTVDETSPPDSCGPITLSMIWQPLDCGDLIFADDFDIATARASFPNPRHWGVPP